MSRTGRLVKSGGHRQWEQGALVWLRAQLARYNLPEQVFSGSANGLRLATRTIVISGDGFSMSRDIDNCHKICQDLMVAWDVLPKDSVMCVVDSRQTFVQRDMIYAGQEAKGHFAEAYFVIEDGTDAAYGNHIYSPVSICVQTWRNVFGDDLDFYTQQVCLNPASLVNNRGH